MLVAEIHGKRLPDAHNHEDSLTSAVFGHLRYVAPAVFWDALFHRAVGLPDANGKERSLTDGVQAAGGSFSTHTSLTAHFWSWHPKYGEPDLILRFSGGVGPALIVLIEVKLGTFKSGVGVRDQLVRYHHILNDLSALVPPFPRGGPDDLRYLVYLTPRESLDEVQDSVSSPGGAAAAPDLFRLRWQDVREAARQSGPLAGEPARTILTDAAHFLQKRGLEYFDGFHRVDGLARITPEAGTFYSAPLKRFHGFKRMPLTRSFKVQHGAWVK